MKHIRLNGIIAAVGLAVMLLLSAHSQAGFYNGSTLLQECESDSAVDYSACIGYIVGALDYQQAMVSWDYLDEPYFCKPDSVNAGQLVKVVTKFLNENPESLHLQAASLVAGALYLAFPCS